MKFRILIPALLFGLSSFLFAQETDADWSVELDPDGPVFVVPVKDMIDSGLAAYIDRAVGDAVEANASLIVFDIDTFGGLVDAADRIRKTILDCPLPTVAFIDKNAASAGALISYAADYIIMVPGASIGAATAVAGESGEKLPEKIQSYMRGLMRATAEANGRDPRIAEAMVDETLSVPGISEAGKLLTLSSSEAREFGVANAVLGSITEVIDNTGLSAQAMFAHQESGLERFLRFIGSPVLASILMLMMLGGLYFELQSPGVGFPGLMALIGALLFFAPNYMNGLVENWEILVFVLGVGLLITEVFVTPGFGLLGAGGIVLVVFSLGASMVGNIGFAVPEGGAVSRSILTLAVTFILLFVVIGLLSRFLPDTAQFKRLVLDPSLSRAAGYTSAASDTGLVGNTGIALTTLRPSGIARIGEKRVDVVSDGGFVSEGATIRVMAVQGSRVEVREIPSVKREAKA